MQSVSENQKILSLKHNWKEFYHKYQITVTIWLLFFLSVAIRSLLANGMKVLSTYEDELLYYGLAENLARNHSFSIYYLPYLRLDRIVYPILIAPAFWAKTRELQFLIIAVINAVLLSSGIFPTYLLAKDILENKLWALFVGVLYIFMPDMAYAGTFMADLCFLPVALWVFYFAYRMLEWRTLSRRERWKYGILFFLMSILACFTKQAGILFLPAFFAAFYFVGLNQKGKKYDTKSKTLLISGMVVLLTLMLFFAVKYINIPVLSRLEEIATMVLEDPSSYLAYNCYSISQMIIAGGIFPILLPYIYYKQYDNKGRRFFIYVACVTLMVLFAESYTQASGRYSIHRIHLRYVLFLWMPYFILFLKLFRQEAWKLNLRAKLGWGILLTWVASMAFWNHGAKAGSFVDYTMLYFIENWDQHWSIHFLALGAYVLLIFFFVLGKQWKRVAIVFFALWFAVQGYNNYAATSNFRLYAIHENESKSISAVEEFISNHRKDTFLLLDEGNDIDNDVFAGGMYRSSHLADTYLNYPNVMRTSLVYYRLREDYKEYYYDLSSNPLPVYLYLSTEGYYYNADHVDYIVVPTAGNCYVDKAKCKQVPLKYSDSFQVYKLNNPRQLPYITSSKNVLRGHNYYDIDCGYFFSRFEDENGDYSFISGEGAMDYVLYGPYWSLPAGDYEVKIYIEDLSGTTNSLIAKADCSSEGQNAVVDAVPVYSGQSEVSMLFSTDEGIPLFETRLYAMADGVRVTGIDIIFSSNQRIVGKTE